MAGGRAKCAGRICGFWYGLNEDAFKGTAKRGGVRRVVASGIVTKVPLEFHETCDRFS